ncbi:DUF6801 domain-containing protein [Actinocorallia longicatena]|uniref:DUF6801 domain-containing protein n=1 Tax=Actinocorallia longicatena TaxID=111803 RepID=A0ABP6QAZ4_9ACTN
MRKEKLRRSATTGLASGAVGGLALGLLGVMGAASPAAAADLDLDFSCNFPIVGVQPVKTHISIPIPAEIEVGQPTGKLPITAVSTINEDTVSGMGLVGGKSLEGKGTSTANITAPTINLNPAIPVSIDPTPVPESGTLNVTAVGSSPSLTFPQVGDIKITVTKLELGPMILRDAAGAPIQLVEGSDTFNAECTIPGGQNTVLATGKVIPKGGGGPTPTPTPPTPTPTPPTPTPTPPTPTPTPPTPTPTPTPPTPTPTPTPPTPTPTPGTKTLKLKGTTHFKHANGKASLKGGIEVKSNASTGKFTAALKLDDTTGTFLLWGVLPAKAGLKFTPVGDVTGKSSKGVITARSRLDVWVPHVKLFGFDIGGGSGCHLKSPVTLNLKSRSKYDPTLSATYTLPKFKNCGDLTGLINKVAPGKGNTVKIWPTG